MENPDPASVQTGLSHCVSGPLSFVTTRASEPLSSTHLIQSATSPLSALPGALGLGKPSLKYSVSCGPGALAESLMRVEKEDLELKPEGGDL